LVLLYLSSMAAGSLTVSGRDRIGLVLIVLTFLFTRIDDIGLMPHRKPMHVVCKWAWIHLPPLLEQAINAFVF
jgi:hypothetical protein